MEPDTSDQGAIARDGTPNPKPMAKGSGKKGKKSKHKPDPAAPPEGATCGEAASPSPTPVPSPKQQGDKPASAKKQKAEKKGEGQDQGQGEGQGQGQGEAVPQKTKAELKAERRAIQEAQRAAKAAKKTEAAAPSQGQAKTETPRVPAKVLRDDPNAQKKEEKKLAKQNVPQRSSTTKKVALFNHLKQYDRDLKHLSELPVWHGGDSGDTQAIHSAVVKLGLQYADYIIIGSNARATALLSAFQEVIQDYKTPEHKDLCRDLDAHIKRLITFLDQCRPLSVSMGNAIKFLKWKISKIPPSMPEQEAKEVLNTGIKKFIKEKIFKASQAIAMYAQQVIKDGEIIIVYGFSSIVFKVLKRMENRQTLTVLVVDNRPRHEGKVMLHRLTRLGIKCVFVTLNLASFYIRKMCQPGCTGRQKTRLLLGAHGVLNNTYVMSRIGTAMLASLAKAHNIPVFVCCETYKISERSQADSFVFNELGDANELEVVGHRPPILCDWKDHKTLGLLNLMYDVTPNDHITTFITEIGLLPDTSIPKVLNTRVSLYET